MTKPGLFNATQQRRREQMSAYMRQWFGATNDGSRELDANNRGVEKRKRQQYRHAARIRWR